MPLRRLRLWALLILATVTAGLLNAVPAAATTVARANTATTARPGSLNDPNLHFAGRWDTTDPSTYVGNWESPYVEATFTGTTVKATVRDAVTVYASVDHGPIQTHSGVSGTVDLTPTPLSPGRHTVWLSYRTGEIPTCATWPFPCATFQGFTFDRGARTLPQPRRKLVEFIGDSITVGYGTEKTTVDSYSWLLGEQLGVDHTNIARSGACLVQLTNCFGLNENWDRTTIGGTTDWDFSRYDADAVVINLGTNDAGRGVSNDDFQAQYTRLLEEARTKYPAAHLYAFQNLRGRYPAQTRAAVQARNDAGDPLVHFIDTENWLTADDYVDGGHPNEAGHAKIAERLVPILAPDLGITVPGVPTDPNIEFTGRWNTQDPAAYVPSWVGAYLTTRFTGTSVTLNQRNTIDFWASIDGGDDVYFAGVKGPVDITPTPLAEGEHTLRISYRNVVGSYKGDAVFQGLTLDPGARTLPTPGRRKPIVEFVGDSITMGTTSSKTTLTSYGWLAGERLGARHTHIAWGGGCLVAAADGCTGVSQQFFRSGTDPWDFGTYQADAVVVNLGTNDLSHHVAPEEFQAVYTQFLQDLRAVYPRSEILVLGTFSGRYLPETQAAVTAAGDRHTRYVDTTGWLPKEGLTDVVHPNDLGHRLIADQLTPILRKALA
ncbi:GDSL-type esterase/lipase family protein [Kineosporia sp. NBRC 101731]|uniref:GDSL-type esterase/lipase family protein n=1 Tax=Kineosporia sp. NBRC 101731 TaxID=3032199 RepID=UPI0024A37298|nr:GDSL-type esterase/lipase family protein [Kineosporia sp. NBRC 101731]GLY30712.1 hypothetical protein Kisp02_40770 [Kineosporia sp. NBRC 101731]